MNIPQEAIETAIDKACVNLRSDFTFEDIAQIVEAAAPHVAAQALRDAAGFLHELKMSRDVGEGLHRGVAASADLLEGRADRLSEKGEDLVAQVRRLTVENLRLRLGENAVKAAVWDECSQWHEDYYVHHQTQPVFDTSAHANPYRERP